MNQEKHYSGLSAQEVENSRVKYGQNILTPPKREPLWKLFLNKFKDPIIRILLIAAFLSLAISFVHNEFAETIGIFCAIFLATFVSFWFEMDASKKFDVLNQVNDETLVKVIRDSILKEIPKKDVVVGDIIILDTGEEIPADGKLLESVSLQVNESTLTGEPVISKTTNPFEFKNDATYPSDMILRGTTVVEGHCVMEVTAVGDSTEFGKVARESSIETNEETPLNRQLDGLAKLIGFIGFILAILTFGVLFLKDIFLKVTFYSWDQLYILSGIFIAFAIASIKIWLPLIFDGFEIFGKNISLPKSVKNGSWFKWIGLGVACFVVLSLIGYLIGIHPFKDSSWISITDAGRILQYFMVAVTLIVVAVPEGLPMSVTLSLALSMRRMLKTNNLVRKMHACETMGATTVICTDKTGTLTQNQMRVHETDFYGLKGENKNANITGIINEGIALNSTAHLDLSDINKVHVLGNPTEGALMLWLNENNIKYNELRDKTKIIDQLTFSTERKFMATLVYSNILKKNVLYIKGAPEIIISKCNDILTADTNKPIEEYFDIINKKLADYQNKAMRTLGFAYKLVDDNIKNPDIKQLATSDFTFIGIAAISDPVREDVAEAVKSCLDAGIDIKIVTGDTPGTAKEIGRQIGIWKETDNDLNIITGIEFENLPDNIAEQRVKDLKIMCRARPTDKQRLVQLLQKNGSIVAVTGDGTNDAPALNFANVGLSMGSGTSVAKEASDITLLDDSFNSIATAVLWGRALYKNIQRFILFQLTINVTALAIVFLGSIFGHELPLTVTQMLWVNLIMDTFAAAALASLPPNPDVMKEKPRRNSDFIITPSMRFNILITSAIFIVSLLGLLFIMTGNNGNIGNYELSCFFTVFVMLQFWNMFNAKAFSTGKSAFHELCKSPAFIIVLLIILAGQLLIVEFGGSVFRTVPISFKDWGIILVSTSGILIIGEIVRLFSRLTKK